MAKAKRLPSGNYRTRVHIGGGVYKSFTAPTKAESEYKASNYLLNHSPSTVDKLQISELVKRFIEEREKYISPSTVRTYLWTYKAHIAHLTTPVDKWDSRTHQEWINNIDLASKTVKNINGLLVSALKYYGVSVPKVSLPQKEFKQIKVPTTAEVKQIIDYFQNRGEEDMVKAVMLSSIGTLRRGEICGLEKEDIKDNTIFVHQAQTINKDEQFVTKGPKTYTSNRLIELPDFLIELISKGDKPVNLTVLQITTKFKHCMKQLGMEYTFHSLRHYSASILHAQNIPTQYIMERGGWKTEDTLNRIYRNSLDDYKKKFNDQTNDYFKKSLM